jgi:hypothetical protein
LKALPAPTQLAASQQAAQRPAESREAESPSVPLLSEVQRLWDGSPQPEAQLPVFLPEPAALAHESRVAAPHAVRPAAQPLPCAA